MNKGAPPFPRGALGSAYSDPATVDTAGNQQMEGMEYWFPDIDHSAILGAQAQRSNRSVLCRIVRNKSGGALLPKKTVKYNDAATNGYDWGNQTNGNAALGDPILGVVDEFLPAAGVPDGELFWVVVAGPSTCISDSAGDTNIGIGKKVVPGGGTAGNLVEQDTTVVTGPGLYNQIQGAVGRLMKAVNATSTDIIVDVGAK